MLFISNGSTFASPLIVVMAHILYELVSLLEGLIHQSSSFRNIHIRYYITDNTVIEYVDY